MKEGNSNGDILELQLTIFGNQLHKRMEGKEELRISLIKCIGDIRESGDQEEGWVWDR